MLLPAQSNSISRRERLQRWVRPSRAAVGFSLVELLLVVGLLLLVSGALIFNFSGLLRGNQLEEGTTRLETLMRFARAQAANSGHKVQLVFGSESATNLPAASTGEVRATWEADPLRQPGCFSDLNDTQWHLQEINDLVQVESVKLIDSGAADPVSNPCPDDPDDDPTDVPAAKPMSPITFYPDGSSDSAEIIVSSRSPEEDTRMAVRLVGITGSISHQLLTANLDDPGTELAANDRPNLTRRENVTRDTTFDRESFRPSSSRALASSTRAMQPALRATVGETNNVDRGE